MNDEIKEILDDLKNKCKYIEDYGYQYKRLSLEDIEILLDYITNLQHQISLMEEDIRESKEINGELKQENERLKEDLKGQENLTLSYCKSEQNYKSRCEKAIEYINHAQNYGTMAQVMPHLKPYVNGDDLLNILQNGSEDNE